MMNPTMTNEEIETQQNTHAKIRKLAQQQGVKPIRKIEDLQGYFCAENENVDEFLKWVELVRNVGKENE